ncbi:MFS transporter [Gordonibacter sp. An230]|uniref:MFS transporter n=1 Tax=Gordonibacter sp. An230 TaxID=1965592 RepID=UPI0013A61344|nr:MFS transporter [Gordonibacter sp. An230]
MGVRTDRADRRHTATPSSTLTTGLVACSAFLLFGLNNVETAALPSYAMALGAGPLVAGLQNSLFVLVAILLRVALERAVDHRGGRFAMIAGALGYTVPCLALAGCTELWQVVVMRLAQAFGLALFQPSVAQYLAAISPASTLGRRLGAVRFATTASLMAGPAAMFPLADSCGYGAFFIALFLTGACGTAIAVALPQISTRRGAGKRHGDEGASAPGTSTKLASAADKRAALASNPTPITHSPLNAVAAPAAVRASTPFRLSPRRRALLIAEPLALALGYSVVMNFGQTLAHETLAPGNDGTLFGLMSAGGLIASPLAGWMADRLGPKCSVAGAAAFNGFGFLLMALGGSPATILAGAFLCGAGYYGATAALVAAAGTSSSSESAGTFLARQQSALDMGMIAGGLLSGSMMQTGLSVSDVCLATSAIIGTSLVIWSMMYPNEKGTS